MNLMAYMRSWSIRTRMLGAIGVVLLFLLLIGGVGLWGMQRLHELEAQTLRLATDQLAALDPQAQVTARKAMADLAARSEAVASQALWLFVWVLGVALLVIVPTTVANMRSLCRPLAQAQGLVVAIARGDLTTQPDTRGQDEVAELMRCLVDMQASLTRTVGEVRHAAGQIALASQDIATGNQNLSERTEQAASNLEETASSMEQITATVKQSAETARAASAMAHDNADVAQRGGQVVEQVVSTMDEINRSSQKIHDIIGVIDGIAFQTNILALNAAVEAARAGEAGRGFAVVAGEVRSLAQRSAEAAHEIKSLISASVEKVDAGTQLVHQAGGTIRDIVTNADKVSAFIAEITQASTEQSQGLAEVNAAVSQLDHMTQENAALVQQSASAADQLREQAQRLAHLVSVFRLMEGGAGGHPPLTPVATRGHGRADNYSGPERRQQPRV